MCELCDLSDVLDELSDVALAVFTAELDYAVDQEIAIGIAKKETYDALKQGGLPIPWDLRAEIEGYFPDGTIQPNRINLGNA